MREWIAAFNTAILTTRAEPESATADLQVLMGSPEFASLIIAAQHLSASQGIGADDAAERIARCFRSVDSIWTATLLKRGMRALID